MRQREGGLAVADARLGLADQILEISDEAPSLERKDSEGNDLLVPIVLDAAAVSGWARR